MKDPFQYTFRFCCDPGFNDKVELEALDRYAEEARIDDVAVFVNVQELNTGHITREEQERYITLIKKVHELMETKGITTSINHWHSVMHADLGKQLHDGQNFRLMVDPMGNRANLCVCPGCENWLEYFTDIYSRYAELNPEILWVEDDFRLHNHDPLIWGGCFCEEHMRIYSERAGKQLTREEFVAGILQSGEVHPYRKIWLDVAQETMLHAAERIGSAVRKVSKSTKVGLMSSVPHVHAAEGRNWSAILKGLAAGLNPVNRIHLPGYIENSPSNYMLNFNMVSMMTRAMIPAEAEVYPELENFPYSRFSKSRRFTRFQLLAGLPLNLAGITIDLYDLNGNGITWKDNYQKTLADTKNYLNQLTGRGIFKGKRAGVKVMFSETSAYTLHTKAGKSMEELYPQEVFFAGLLSAFGIPFVYCNEPDVKDSIVAISGQYFRNLSKEQIESIFEHNDVIINGDAAATLFDLGLGDLANIKSLRWMHQDQGEYSYEQVTNQKEYYGMENARASAIIICSDAVDVEYHHPIKEYSAFYNSFRERTAAAETVSINTRGKSSYLYPFGNFEQPLSVSNMLLNSIRQCILQEALTEMSCGESIVPYVVGEPYLIPYVYPWEKGYYIYLVNASTDHVDNIKLYMNKNVAEILVYHSDKAEEVQAGFTREGGFICIAAGVLSMESVLITVITEE